MFKTTTAQPARGFAIVITDNAKGATLKPFRAERLKSAAAIIQD